MRSLYMMRLIILLFYFTIPSLCQDWKICFTDLNSTLEQFSQSIGNVQDLIDEYLNLEIFGQKIPLGLLGYQCSCNKLTRIPLNVNNYSPTRITFDGLERYIPSYLVKCTKDHDLCYSDKSVCNLKEDCDTNWKICAHDRTSIDKFCTSKPPLPSGVSQSLCSEWIRSLLIAAESTLYTPLSCDLYHSSGPNDKCSCDSKASLNLAGAMNIAINTLSNFQIKDSNPAPASVTNTTLLNDTIPEPAPSLSPPSLMPPNMNITCTTEGLHLDFTHFVPFIYTWDLFYLSSSFPIHTYPINLNAQFKLYMSVDVSTNGIIINEISISLDDFTISPSVDIDWSSKIISLSGSAQLSNATVEIKFLTPSSTWISFDDFIARLPHTKVEAYGSLTAVLQLDNSQKIFPLPNPIIYYSDDNIFQPPMGQVGVDFDITNLKPVFTGLSTSLAGINFQMSTLGVNVADFPGLNLDQIFDGIGTFFSFESAVENYYDSCSPNCSLHSLANYLSTTTLTKKRSLQETNLWDTSSLSFYPGSSNPMDEVVLVISFEATKHGPVDNFQEIIGGVFSVVNDISSGVISDLTLPNDIQFDATVSVAATFKTQISIGLKTSSIDLDTITTSIINGAFIRVDDISCSAIVSANDISLVAGSVSLKNGSVAIDFSYSLSKYSKSGISILNPNVVKPGEVVTAVDSPTVTVAQLNLDSPSTTFKRYLSSLNLSPSGIIRVVLPFSVPSLPSVIIVWEKDLFSNVPVVPSIDVVIDTDFENILSSLKNNLDNLLNVDLNIPSLPDSPSLPKPFSNFNNIFDFEDLFNRFKNLVLKFPSYDFTINTRESDFSLALLKELKISFPDLFINFDSTGLDTKNNIHFDPLDYLTHIRALFGHSTPSPSLKYGSLPDFSDDWNVDQFKVYLNSFFKCPISFRTLFTFIKSRMPTLEELNSGYRQGGFDWSSLRVPSLPAFQTFNLPRPSVRFSIPRLNGLGGLGLQNLNGVQDMLGRLKGFGSLGDLVDFGLGNFGFENFGNWLNIEDGFNLNLGSGFSIDMPSFSDTDKITINVNFDIGWFGSTEELIGNLSTIFTKVTKALGNGNIPSWIPNINSGDVSDFPVLEDNLLFGTNLKGTIIIDISIRDKTFKITTSSFKGEVSVGLDGLNTDLHFDTSTCPIYDVNAFLNLGMEVNSSITDYYGQFRTSLVVDVSTSDIPINGLWDNLGDTIVLSVSDDDVFSGSETKVTADLIVTDSFKTFLEDTFNYIDIVGNTINSIDVLDETIPFINTSLNGLLNYNTGLNIQWGDFLIWRPTLNNFSCGSDIEECTLSAFTTVCEDRIRDMLSNSFVSNFLLNLGYEFENSTFRGHFSIGSSIPIYIRPDVGNIVNNDFFTFDVTAGMVVNIVFNIDFEIVSVGIDSNPSTTFTLNDFTIGLEVDGNIDVRITAGVLTGYIKHGQVKLEVGSSALYKGVKFPISNINFTMTQPKGSFEGIFPFNLIRDGYDITDVSGVIPTLYIKLDDVFNSSSKNLTWNPNPDSFFQLSTLSVSQILNIIRQVASSVDSYRNTQALELPLPFTNKDVGDVVNFGDMLLINVLDILQEPIPASRRSSLSLTLKSEIPDNWDTMSSDDWDLWVPVGNFTLTIDNIEIPVSVNVEELKSVTSLSEITDIINNAIVSTGYDSLVTAVIINDNGVNYLQLNTVESAQAEYFSISIKIPDSTTTSTPTTLGLQDGQTEKVQLIAKFDDLPSFINLLNTLFPLPNVSGANLNFSKKDDSFYQLLFRLHFEADVSPPSIDFSANVDLKPVIDVNGTGEVYLNGSITFDFEFGVVFGKTPDNLAIIGSLQNNQNVTSYSNNQNSSFAVVLEENGEKVNYVVNVPEISPGNFISTLRNAVELSDIPSGSLSVLEFPLNTTGFNNYILQSYNSEIFGVLVDDDSSKILGLQNSTFRSDKFNMLVNDLNIYGSLNVGVRNINILAQFMFIDISTLNSYADIHTSLNMSLHNTSNPNSPIIISELRKSLLDNPLSLVDVEFEVGADINLSDIDVSLPFFNGISGSITATMGDRVFNLIQDNNTLPTNSNLWNVDVNFPQLNSLRGLSFDNILDLILQVTIFLAGDPESGTKGILSNKLLDFDIPVVEVRVGDITDFTVEILEAIEKVSNNPTSSLRNLELYLESQLGLKSDNVTNCVGSCLIEFNLIQYDSNSYSLQFGVDLTYSIQKHSVLNLDFKKLLNYTSSSDVVNDISNFIDVSGSVVLDLEGSVSFFVGLGVNISLKENPLDPNISNPFILGTSNVEFDLRTSAVFPEFDITIGSLTFPVGEGHAVIDRDGDINTMDSALLRIGMVDTSMNYDIKNIFSALEVDIIGAVDIEFVLELASESIRFDLSIPNLENLFFSLHDSVIFSYSPSQISLSDILSKLLPSININPLQILLTSPDALVNGYDHTLQLIETSIHGAGGIVTSIPIPIVGNAVSDTLSQGDKFIGNFRQQSVTKIKSLISSVLGDDLKKDSMVEIIQTGLFNLFHDDLDILLSHNLIEKAKTVDDIFLTLRNKTGFKYPSWTSKDPIPYDADSIEWDFVLGKIISPSFTPSFYLGIDGLPLSLGAKGDINLVIEWYIQISMGLSISKGFFIVPNKDFVEFKVEVNVGPNFEADGHLFFLEAKALENGYTGVIGDFTISLQEPKGTINPPDNRVTIQEFLKGPKNIFSTSYLFNASVNLDLSLGTEISWVPTLHSGFYAGFAFGSKIDTSTQVYFSDVYLDLTVLLNNILNPIFDKVDTIFDPIRPIINAIQKPLPVISDIAGTKVAMKDLPLLISSGVFGPTVDCNFDPKTIKSVDEFINMLIELDDIISTLEQLAGSGNFPIASKYQILPTNNSKRYVQNMNEAYYLGDFELHHLWHMTPVKVPSLRSRQKYPTIIGAREVINYDIKKRGLLDNCGRNSVLCKLTSSNYFEIPLLKTPSIALGLISGKDIDLFRLRSPELILSYGFTIRIPLTPIPGVYITFGGGVGLQLRIEIGFDTYGVRQAISTKNWLLAGDGFFISTTYNNVPLPQASMTGFIEVGAELNVFVLRAGACGRITFIADIRFYDPNTDGKVRISEMISLIEERNNPIDLFTFHFGVKVGIRIYVQVNTFLFGWHNIFSKSWNVPLLSIDSTPGAPPVLAKQNGGVVSILPDWAHGYSGQQILLNHIDGESGKETIQLTITGNNGRSYSSTFYSVSSIIGNINKASDIKLGAVSSALNLNVPDGSTLSIDYTSASDPLSGIISDYHISGFSSSGITHSGFTNIEILLPDSSNTVTITSTPLETTFNIVGGSASDTYILTPEVLDSSKRALVPIERRTSSEALFITEKTTDSTGYDIIRFIAGDNTSSTDGVLYYNSIVGLAGGSASTTYYSGVEEIQIVFGGGPDEFLVSSTSSDTNYVKIYGCGGADTITVGNNLKNIIGKYLVISGGCEDTVGFDVDDTLVVSDVYENNPVTCNVSALDIQCTNFPGSIQYSQLNYTKLTMGTGNDFLYVESTYYQISILSTGDGDDHVEVFGVNGDTTVKGGNGSDIMLVPYLISGNTSVNPIVANLTMDGEIGDDETNIYFAGTGTSFIHVDDTSFDGYNTMNVYATNQPDNILFRSTKGNNWMALLHQITCSDDDLHGKQAYMERLLYDNIQAITFYGKGGNDVFAFDNTNQTINVYAGDGDDRFYIGQLYNNPRNDFNLSALPENEQFNTTHVNPDNWLSDGCNQPLFLYGQNGNDNYVILRNRAQLELYGGPDNDSFIVKSFQLYTDTSEYNASDPQSRRTKVFGESGYDMIAYVQSAPVDIYGGDGFDSVFVIGTHAGDNFVIMYTAIYGAGHMVTFIGIESIEVDGDAGDDHIFIYSTPATASTRVFGGLGSDIIHITPYDSTVVVADDLRGYSGVIEHSVQANGPYGGLKIDGISVNVRDADDMDVWIIENQAQNIVYSGTDSGPTSFSYQLVLSKQPNPNEEVRVSIFCPRPPQTYPDTEHYLYLDDLQPNIVTFNSVNWNVPQTVTATASSTPPPGSGKQNLKISHSPEIHDISTDTLKVFSNAVRSLDVLYLDAITPDVVHTETNGVTRVGENSFVDTFRVDVFPCPPPNGEEVTVKLYFNPSQITVSPSSFTVNSFSTSCNSIITVSAVADGIIEGFHFETISFEVFSSFGKSSSYNTTWINDLIVQIGDYDAPGVWVMESNLVSEVAESATDIPIAITQDTYDVVLTSPPGTGVTITANPVPTQTANIDGVISISVNPPVLTFTNNNWNKPQTVVISGLSAKGQIEGHGIKVFSNHLSEAAFIQGPLLVNGGVDPTTLPPPCPFLLETKTIQEIDKLKTLPPGSTEFVNETVQFDTLIIWDQNNYKSSNLLFDPRVFTGLGIQEGRSILSVPFPSGIIYSEFEYVGFNLGKGNYKVIINDTTEKELHVNTDTGIDNFEILKISGPTFISGGPSSDTITVGTGSTTVLQGLLVVDGGDGSDTLTLYNNDDTVDNCMYLSRSTITGINMTGNSLSDFIYSVTVVADYGEFVIPFSINGKEYQVFANISTDSETLESLFYYYVYPNSDAWASCGTKHNSDCAPITSITKVDNTYFIIFTGELTGEKDITVSLDYSLMKNPVHEYVGDVNIDVIPRNDGVNYYNIEQLTVELGSGSDSVNIRGTHSTDHTTINLNDGDDAIYVSSMADYCNAHSPRYLSYFHGWLDYIETDIYLNAGDGRHILYVSDELTNFGKGPGTLSESALSGMSLPDASGGDIYYSVGENGNFLDGIMIRLGNYSDEISVVGTLKTSGIRTTTILNTGGGDDILNEVSLDDSKDDFFVLYLEEGNDFVNGSLSTLPLMVFGFSGKDTIITGSGNDIIMGDFGRVYYVQSNSTERPVPMDDVVAYFGSGGIDDYFDGVIRNVRYAIAHTEYGTSGGADVIFSGSGWDSIFGGLSTDTINGENDQDLIFGDHGYIDYDINNGFDILHAEILQATEGDGDTIYGGNHDDIIFGGPGNDFINGDGGNDVILGDNGYFDINLPLHQQVRPLNITELSVPCNDVINGGSGDDFIYGLQGNDTINGGSGDDDITGGHNVPYGYDGNDVIIGENGEDYIIGDNGVINRTGASPQTVHPFPSYFIYDLYPGTFHSTIRLLQRFDDLDKISGDDIIYGGNDRDVIHGQRGNDIIYGDRGDDELYGEIGEDYLYGGDDEDFILGDVGVILRAFDDNGLPLINTKTGIWHRDIVLEEVVSISNRTFVGKKMMFNNDISTFTNLSSRLMHSEVLVIGYDLSDTTTSFLRNDGTSVELIHLTLEQPYDDVIDGGNGDDFLFGQRGSDTISGDGDNDYIFGDFAQSTPAFPSSFPFIVNVVRYIADDTGEFILDEFGNVFHIPIEISDESYYPALTQYFYSSIGFTLPPNVPRILDDWRVHATSITYLDGSYFRPVARFVPSVARTPNVGPKNDVLDGGDGNDIVVGDKFLVISPIDLTESLPVHFQDGLERVWDRFTSLAHRLETIDVDLAVFELQHLESAKIGCDTITGGNGDDILVGDDMIIIAGILSPTTFSPSEFQNRTVDLYNYYRDLELITTYVESAYYEAHHHLLLALNNLALNSDFINRPIQQDIHYSEDTISGEGGKDFVFGDHCYFMTDAIPRPISEEPVQSQVIKTQIEDYLNILEGTRNAELENHINTFLNWTTAIDFYINIPNNVINLPGDHYYPIWNGNDIISGNADDSDDILAGDFGILGISILGSRIGLSQDFSLIELTLKTKYSPGSPIQTFFRKKTFAVSPYDQSPEKPFNGMSYYRNRDGTNLTPVPDPKRHANTIFGGPGNDLISSHFLSMVIPISSSVYKQSTSTNAVISPFDFKNSIQFFGYSDDQWPSCILNGGTGENVIITSTSLDNTTYGSVYKYDGVIPQDYKLTAQSMFYDVVEGGNIPQLFEPLMDFIMKYPVKSGWTFDVELGNFLNATTLVTGPKAITPYTNDIDTFYPISVLFNVITILVAIGIIVALAFIGLGRSVLNKCRSVYVEV